MKVAVRYYTRSGNTKKLADEIAKAVGVEAKSVSEGLNEDVDILFLGSSVYAAGIDDEVKKFISQLDVKVGMVANFSTAALLKSTYKRVRNLLSWKDIPMAEEEYYCRGSFGPMHKGRPNADDLEKAVEYAKRIASTI